MHRGPGHTLQQRANITGRQLIIILLWYPRCRSGSGDNFVNFTLEFRKNLYRPIGLCALSDLSWYRQLL